MREQGRSEEINKNNEKIKLQFLSSSAKKKKKDVEIT